MEVGNERVKLFENSNSGVIVVTDDMLENSISIAVKTSSAALSATDEAAASKRAKKAVAAAVKRAKVITIEFSFKAQGYPRFHGWKEDELRASCQSPTPSTHHPTPATHHCFHGWKEDELRASCQSPTPSTHHPTPATHHCFHGWKEDELRASCQSPTPGDHYETTMISFVFNSSKLTAGNFKHWTPFFQNSKKKKVEPKSAGL